MVNNQRPDDAPVREEKRRAEIVRLIVTRRERAPRSPRMERALKRLIWRYVGQADPPPAARVVESKHRKG